MSDRPIISIHICLDASWEGYARQMFEAHEAQQAEEDRRADLEHERLLYSREADMLEARRGVDPYAPEPYEERTEVEYVDAVFAETTIETEPDAGNPWEWAEWR